MFALGLLDCSDRFGERCAIMADLGRFDEDLAYRNVVSIHFERAFATSTATMPKWLAPTAETRSTKTLSAF